MTAYEQRSYTGAAADTLLAADLASGGASFSVTPGTGTGYPDGSEGPFHVIIDYDTSKAEKIRCSGRVNDTFTVAGTGGGRGQDGTSAQAHLANAKVRAVWTATDAQEANRAAANTVGQVIAKGDVLTGSGANTLARTAAGADGSLVQFDSTQGGGVKATNPITGDPVGTTGAQTLANKTLTTPTIGDFTNAGHTHAGASSGGQLAQANTHGSADTDTSTAALHHTIGAGAAQAAAGNHNHSGVYQPAGSYSSPGHTHAESDVTSLVSDLAGKASSGHNHTASGLNGITRAEQAITTDSSGKVTITHGLGTTPTVVVATHLSTGGGANNGIQVGNLTSTTFDLFLINTTTGATANNASTSVAWIAMT